MDITRWSILKSDWLYSLQPKMEKLYTVSKNKTRSWLWKFTVHVLLKPGLENFAHYFASMWDECSCVVVGAFFGIALLWDWNEKWTFPVLWPLLSFQICWHIGCSTFTASSFRIWNSSTGIPSPPLALFVMMLPKAHLPSHSRMSGSRWVITPSWLSRSLRSFLYSPSVYIMLYNIHFLQ